MTLEERLNYLQQAAMEEARAQANAITKKQERSLSKVAQQHRDEMNKQLKLQTRTEKIRARQQRNIEVSKEQLKLKRAYRKRQMELKNDLFEEVTVKLLAYMKTSEYIELLKKYIQEAIAFAGDEEMTLYINPSDADKKEVLEAATGAKLTISKEDFIGGVRAVIRGRNVLIDHAFKGAMEQEYQDFMFRGGAKIV